MVSHYLSCSFSCTGDRLPTLEVQPYFDVLRPRRSESLLLSGVKMILYCLVFRSCCAARWRRGGSKRVGGGDPPPWFPHRVGSASFPRGRGQRPGAGKTRAGGAVPTRWGTEWATRGGTPAPQCGWGWWLVPPPPGGRVSDRWASPLSETSPAFALTAGPCGGGGGRGVGLPRLRSCACGCGGARVRRVGTE